ncbi:DUF1885 family protein [Paenibacillus sp. IB182496]|uniref:DUF1885 family protein n=1 Tax=Paenibacillus sabuli TaxID=2772509 RepID=A0A927BV54_9BACL|nr:DUF1885 family protein [Paenibacillus sabuli]MBD2846235.1 DUF1885 family protein [Paenibacillus sabuli]
MSQSAYIVFVEGSEQEKLTLDEIKQQLLHYREQMALTGRQLNWDYADAAFPYVLAARPGEEDQWFYLEGRDPMYRFILFGTGSSAVDGTQRHHIQIVLPEGATHGDKAKANELCKFIAKRLKAQLRLFNGRTLHYNPRK